jgi:hypothetical protein
VKNRRAALQSIVLGSLGLASTSGAASAKKKKKKSKKKKTCPTCPTCETTTTPRPNFCNTNPGEDCHASGSVKCFCGMGANGARVCIAAGTQRGVAHCGLCTSHEVCTNRTGDVSDKGCAIPCAYPK